MSWPTMSDYQEAIQNPANCFSDRTLTAGKPSLNALGLPQPITGGFCSVYQVTSGKTRWAVRCFLHNIEDLRERYAKISGYLRGHKVKQMVGFEYLPEGIRVRGEWNPILKMEWVDGDTLNNYVEKNLKNAGALRKLAERWAELMEALEKAHIGHCDLQHGNVMVDGAGQFRLIDYDGMYVPPLKGRGSHEKGHPAYQHPQREGRDFDESVDRFSALVIHTTLMALAEAPDLWKRHYDEDNFLFRRADFQHPESSAVFKELEKMRGAVADSAKLLHQACKKKLSDTPRLRDVRGRKLQAAAEPPVEVAPTPVAVAPEQNGNGSKRASEPARPKSAPVLAVVPPPKQAAKRTPAASAPAPAPRPARVAPPAPVSQSAIPKPNWMGGGAAVARAPVTPPAPARPAPRSAPAAVAPPAARTTPAPRSAPAAPPDLQLVQPASAPLAPATPGSGWDIDWVRPGQIDETHIWQLPIFGTREAPRRILGLTFGTMQERYVERYEEKVEERTTYVGGHRSAVTALAFTPDGRLLASGSRDGTLRVWNVQSGREAFAPLELRSSVVSMALAPDRQLVAAVLKDRRLVLWEFGPKRQVIHLYAPDRSRLRAVTVSNDGRWVAAGGSRRSIFTWKTERGVASDEIKNTTGRIQALAFTPDANGIVCGTHKGRLELFERGSSAARWSIKTGLGRIVSLAVPARSGDVVGGAAEGTVAWWNPADGSETQRVRPMLGRITSLAASPDSALLLAGLASGEACVTEAATSRQVAIFEGHSGAVTSAAFASSGKCAATGTTDGTVRLWLLR